MKNTAQVKESSSQKGTRGLKEKDFHRIAQNGFGDPHNAYPHSMIWFKDHIYVGTTRSILILIRNHTEELQKWEVFPVKYPKEIWELDLRAQIWRYHPPTQKWSRVLISPFYRAKDGSEVSTFNGIRMMLVFQGKSDFVPTLYALSMSHEKGPGALLLRSEDGINFDQLSISGIGNETFSSYRPLVAFKGRLFTAPVGKNRAPNAGGFAFVLESDDPVKGKWTVVNELGFGDKSNLSVFEMAVFNDHLYAGTLNPKGYQLWKTDCEGKPPYQWKKVLARGAERGSSNESVASMCEFNGALYVGSLIQNGGFDRKNLVGPAPAELVRVYPDDSWELIAGDARIINGSLKVPLSGLTSGFGNFFTGYFWRMCVHEGWLYLGTLDWSTFIPYAPRDKWTEEQQKKLDEYRLEELMKDEAGFDLWKTHDGIQWFPVTKNGFGNPFNYGARTMISTPHGLFLGAANPFGEDIAVKRTAGWFYEPNMRGGCEIWVGREGSYDEKLKCYPDKPFKESEHISSIITGNDKTQVEQDFCERTVSEYYGDTNFRNFGFWTKDTKEIKDACRNLTEELLSHLPKKEGKILDLGCGYGGSTRFLLKYYLPEAITGICLERKELEIAQVNFPNIKFFRAIVPRSPIKDEHFDTIINVEQLSCYDTGLQWLEETFSLLNPGGYLICAEILSDSPNSPWRKRTGLKSIPITTPVDFQQLLLNTGLEEVRVYDCTNQCWQAFHKNLSSYLYTKLLKNEIDEEISNKIIQSLYGKYGPICSYVLAVGRKPIQTK